MATKAKKKMRPNARNVKKAKKFQIDWEATGSCEIKADSQDEAFDKFNSDPAKYGAPARSRAVYWGEDGTRGNDRC